jgi:diguanylate cyclase (GGDEF)-like protein/PAS domain S-box-containing protein
MDQRAKPSGAVAASDPAPFLRRGAEPQIANAGAIVCANMDDIVYHLAVEGEGRYRFLFINPAFEKATALAPAQVIGKMVEEVIPEPSCSMVLAQYRDAIRTGATRRWEEVTECPAGLKVGAVSITPVFDGNGKPTDLIGTVHDITELKQQEQQLFDANAEFERALAEQGRLSRELQSSEERLRFALEGTGEGVWDWDIGAGQVFYSKQWKRILGLDDEAKIDPRLWRQRIHPDDLPELVEMLRICLTSDHQVCTQEHRIWHESGRYIWARSRGSVVAHSAAGAPARMVGTILDITETVRLRQQLDASHDLLAKLAQQVPGALFEFVLPPEGQMRCTYISAMAQELFELSPEQINADWACLQERILPRDQARMRRALRRSAAMLQPWRIEFQVHLPHQGPCWRELNAKPTRLPDGSTAWHGFTDDISERKRTEQTIRQFNATLERRAHYDALTGLPNRALFRDRLEQGIKLARAAHSGLALLFIDLDRFKQVNDLLGHDVGDALLTQAARRIEECVQPGDTVARLGGDEFTVILTETSEITHVEQVAQCILEKLSEPFQLENETAYVSASIGIAQYPVDAETPEQLMRHADQAMYRSKAAGRNQLTFFEPAMQEAAMNRLRVTSALRQALAEHQLELYFQPIIELGSGRIVKAEALLRWHSPELGLVMPGDFIDIAEESGQIHQIGNWVFEQAIHWSKCWSAMTGSPFQISINKSPLQFQNQQQSHPWVALLKQLAVPANSIAVEITENVLVNLSGDVSEKLYQLQEGGIEVSIDDFGTGYSSMSYLKRLAIDYLKIDRSFVSEMMNDSTSRTITETIIVMAHKLGLKVVAEGVETAAQRDWLAEQCCDYAQGYLFARAIPAGDFERMLAQQAATPGAAMAAS